ncbi:MAG: hypothetical protein HRT61_22760, partial [Ekhidna sp.]|nr:hypothetical protein [Ekhidna sp.]
MKYLLILVVPTLAFCQEGSVKEIKSRCIQIDEHLNSFTKIYTPDINVYSDLNQNHSIESMQIYRLAMIDLTRYYDSDLLIKAEVRFEGDRQTLHSTYYFDEGNLIFVSQNRMDFAKPKWSDEFDEKEFTSLESAYYFDTNKLIRWTKNGSTILEESEDFEKTKIILKSDAKTYQDYRLSDGNEL